MNESRMQVIVVEPGKEAELREIGSGLESLQETVGGWIEVVYPYKDPVAIVCNEEGKLIGLEPNRRLGKDILCGVFYIIAEDEEGNLVSLSSSQVDKYTALFWHPDVIDADEVADTVIYKIFPL